MKDGNDVEAICGAVEMAKQDTARPKLLVLHTVKGLGCPAAFAAGLPTNHNMPVSAEAADRAIALLLQEKEAIL